MSRCPGCDNPVYTGDRFCENCGRELSSAEHPSASSPRETPAGNSSPSPAPGIPGPASVTEESETDSPAIKEQSPPEDDGFFAPESPGSVPTGLSESPVIPSGPHKLVPESQAGDSGVFRETPPTPSAGDITPGADWAASGKTSPEESLRLSRPEEDHSEEYIDDVPLKAYLAGRDSRHLIVVFKNLSESALENVLIHAGSMVRELPLVKPEKTVLFVPAESEFLSLSCHLAGRRGCWRWSLEGRSAPEVPVLEVGHATDIDAEIVMKGSSDLLPRLKMGHAGSHKLKVVYDLLEDDRRPRRLLPLVGSWQTAGHRFELVLSNFRRFLLFTGSELTIGRSGSKSDWMVQARDGNAILGWDKQTRRWLHLSPNEVKGAPVLFPVSRIHATLKWLGDDAVQLLDGSLKRPSTRGLFWTAGEMPLLVDSGWHRCRLPSRIFLGRPDEEVHVEIEMFTVTDEAGQRSLCLRQPQNPEGELLIWNRPGAVFGFAAKPNRFFYPVWNEGERSLCLLNKGTAWQSLSAPPSTRVSGLYAGSELKIGPAAYRVESADPRRAVVVRNVGI